MMKEVLKEVLCPLLLILNNTWYDKEIPEDDKSADGMSVLEKRVWVNTDNNRPCCHNVGQITEY